MKYIKGSIFLNTIISSLSEIPSYLLSGYFYYKVGIKLTLIPFFSVAILGSILYMTIKTSNDIAIAIMVLGTKFGISGTFNVAY